MISLIASLILLVLAAAGRVVCKYRAPKCDVVFDLMGIA